MSSNANLRESAPQIPWVPNGRPDWHEGWINGYARGLQLIANYVGREGGHRATYDAVLGDMGVCFTMPSDASSVSRQDGLNHPGWWPQEPLGFLRLAFLEPTLGLEVTLSVAPESGLGADPVAVYDDRFGPAIQDAVDAGRPALLGFDDWWCVVTGYDPEDLSPHGMCPNVPSGDERVEHVALQQVPLWLLTVDGEVAPLDRLKADRESLRYALALQADEALPDENLASTQGEPRHRYKAEGEWCTGKRSYATWISWMNDATRIGEPAHPHANTKGFLVRNRRSAARYLREMARRHSPALGGRFESAATALDAVAEAASAIGIAEDTIGSLQGRRAIVAQIVRVAQTDELAFAEIGEIVEVMA